MEELTIARRDALAAALAAERPGEFEERLRGSHRLVYQIAFGVLANAADAEEVTQDAFLCAYRKLGSLRDPGKFRAWVARMSWRLALNRQRASARALRRDTAWFESAAPSHTGNLSMTGEFNARLRQEIDRLPEKLRSVLLLTAMEGLETREVAEILEVPEGTVRSRLHLARKELLRRFCR